MSVGLIMVLTGVFGLLIVAGFMLLNKSKQEKQKISRKVNRGVESKPKVESTPSSVEKPKEEENKVKQEPVKKEQVVESVPAPKEDIYIKSKVETSAKTNDMEIQNDRVSVPNKSNDTVILKRKPDVIAFLVVKNGPNKGDKYDINDGDNTIGRGNNNYISIEESTVSEQHAVVRSENGEFTLYDLASTNGTFLNEEKIAQPKILNNGDTITIGKTDLCLCRID